MSEIILPNLPALQPGAKQKLIAIADVYAKGHKENVLHYLETGEVTFEELPLLNNVPEIKKWLEDQYNAWRYPVDPDEQEAQRNLLSTLPATVEGLDELSVIEQESIKDQLQKYLADYSTSLPTGNIVPKVKEYLDRIEVSEQKVREEEEWRRVDSLSYTELMRYYANHPSTPFYNELADSVWDLIKCPPVDLAKVNEFISSFPRSEHNREAREILNEYEEWQLVSTAGDLRDVHDYIQRHFGGAFFEQAQSLLTELKKTELLKYQSNPARLDMDSFEDFVRKGLFSEDDFIAAGLATRDSIDTARKRVEISDNYKIDHTKWVTSCPDGATDVYMFGVPSTGKTCVLMGLLKSKNILYDPVQFGGDYANSLRSLCNKGVTPGHTESDFISLISATVNDQKIDGVQHKINLIDMPGEDFFRKIAQNRDANVSFEDMGNTKYRTLVTNEEIPNYIPQMLRNDNEKIFFIVIDPTTDLVVIKREEVNDAGRKEMITYYCEQATCLDKFISMLDQPVNEEIMKKVRAIHIIVAKADTFGENRSCRNGMAKNLLVGQSSLYEPSVRRLKKICADYDINGITGNNPKAFNFSLGKFYMGGVFQYDSSDADSLLNAISMISSGTRTKKTLAEKIQIWFNE